MTTPSASLSIAIAVDDKTAKTNLAAIGESVKKLGLMTETAFAKKSMGVLDVKSYAEVKAEMGKLTAAYRGLATSGKASAVEQGKALESLRAKQRELYATISNPPKLDMARSVLGVSSQRSVAAEIDKVRQAYATLSSSGRASLAELARAKIAMGQKIDELRQKTNNWRDALGDIKGRMVEAAAASAGLVLAAKAGVDFESAMADVRKVVDGSPEDIAMLGKELQKLSGIIPLSAVELAKIATAGGQLGIAAKDILPFVEVTAKMATAFDMTAEEAGNAIGKLKNVFGLSIAEISQFGDAINQLGNTSAAREREIVEVMLRVGGTSKQFGLAKEQTAALAAAMLSLGKPAEVAATSINSLLNRLQTATMQEPPFTAALEKIGMTAEQMAAAVEANPQQALLNLLETLEKLDGRQKSEVLTGLFGREFQDDIGVLVGALDTYRETLQQVGDENQYAGAMLEEFKKRSETAKNQLILLKNEVVRIATNIGTGFLPAIKASAAILTGLLKPISELTGAFPKLSAAIVGVGTGLIVFKTVATAVGILRSALTIFSADAVTKLGRVGTAVSKLGPLFKWAGGVVAAFGVGWEIGSFLNKFEIVRKAGIAMAGGLTNAWLQAKKAWALLFGTDEDVARVQRELKQAEQIYAKMFADVGKEAEKSAADQLAAQKKVTAGAKESATEQAAAQKKATKEMVKAYEEYGDHVKEIQDDIADRERSLAEKLRAMSRSGMSDLDAWKDRKKEAAEFAEAARRAEEAAKKAFAAGDNDTGAAKYEEAVDLYDKASEAAADLNEEIKNGDKVIQGQNQSLKISKQLVEEYGKAGIEAQKEYQQAISDLGKALDKESGGSLSKELPDIAKRFGIVIEQAEDLSGKSEKFNKAWNSTWDEFLEDGKSSMHELDQKLTELSKDRHIKIYVTEVQKRMHGGLIRDVQKLATGGLAGWKNMLSGGHFPGFGGGDKIKILGEAGEYMLNKFATSEGGIKAATYFNNRNWPALVRELIDRFNINVGQVVRRATGGPINSVPVLPAIPQGLATGGPVVDGGSGGGVLRHEHNLRTADGQRATVYTDDFNADRFISMLERALVMSS